MPLRKNAPIAASVRKPRHSNGGHALKRHPVPLGREEKHMGATEDQVSVTMPPKADDDEPKQG